MPNYPIKYLVHDLFDMTQSIHEGQVKLLSFMSGIGCTVDKNHLAFVSHGTADIKSLDKGPVFVDENMHDIVIEELFE